ncbi:hypothetical protein GCM10023084_07110 [Streptomyces lacrimifluminis]|uniref:Uncharacterized protein n=1 Tax=Streptomyces lacrimifluminis TaxID=1500077 RepID=A0A917KSH4_9ACTN|nr:hypothetical protein [Streptomyces lacrimifluminis]GGJ25667.1 hypothetical protein GCM10012282_22760 [Streptomyces lacrimifluminis]
MHDRPNRTDTDLLGIYLNDHLAGATLGTDRARSLAEAEAERDPALADAVGPLSDEIAEDRADLVRIMRSLDVPVRRYKIVAGRLAERAGRLKANGRIVRRSPLTPVVELELLRLGVEAKVAVWRTLRRLADADDRLDPVRLDGLLGRADRQLDTLEQLRLRQVDETFKPRAEALVTAR